MPDSPLPAPPTVQPRILIFIVAYNARTTLRLGARPHPRRAAPAENVEVLVIDDSSPDDTFQTGVEYVSSHRDDSGLKITVLRNPENQRYGGNQKLGYRYAIEHGFDFVALVHGDGQYAPECLPDLLAPLDRGRGRRRVRLAHDDRRAARARAGCRSTSSSATRS